MDHDLHTVERLNARIARGEFADIVRETDRGLRGGHPLAAQIIEDRSHGASARGSRS